MELQMPFEQFTPRSRTPVRANAPAASGIYGASNAREWIYIGETDNIQASRLNEEYLPTTKVTQGGFWSW